MESDTKTLTQYYDFSPNHWITMKKDPIQMKSRLADIAYELIHKKIITLEFEPGQQLDEKDLASTLDIGRTPIREALLKLSSEFMVESMPKRGFAVSQLAFQNVKPIFDALRILELGIAQLAVQQNDPEPIELMQENNDQFKKLLDKPDFLTHFWLNHEFHICFAKCAGNDYLLRALKSVRNEVNRLTFMSFKHQNPQGDQFKLYNIDVYKEHQKIIDCVVAKDLPLLQNTIDLHIQSFQKKVFDYLTG